MPLPKPIKDLKIAVFLPCYKRPEYTEKCIQSLRECDKPCDVTFCLVDDGSCDNTAWILQNSGIKSSIKINTINEGLRNITIDFFQMIQRMDYDFIAKIDNDCTVPRNWLPGILEIFKKADVDILSPNVHPSNAAFIYGKEDVDELGYRPAEIVGGLWVMKASLLKDLFFERHSTFGLTGTISLLKQIVVEKEPQIGWAPDILVEDIGHWSGKHPLHIKSKEHEEYSLEVGREIAWRA